MIKQLIMLTDYVSTRLTNEWFDIGKYDPHIH